MSSISPLKAKPLRNPGQSLDEEIQELIDEQLLSVYWIAAMFVVMAMLEWLAVWLRWPRNPIIWTLVAVLAILYFAWLFRRVRKRARQLRLGRDGERAVGQYLEGLREAGARVFHDVPGDAFNLDHVVISRHGLFIVETKTCSKPHPKAQVSVRGKQVLLAGHVMTRNPVEQVRAQIAWLEQLLEQSTGKRLPIRGAVVFPGWFIERSSDAKRLGVWVLEPKALPAFIENEPVRLTDADVALASFHLSRYVRAKNEEAN
jgi:hypothetical protein